MDSSVDPLENLEKIDYFAQSAKKGRVDLVVFPENCLCLGSNDSIANVAEEGFLGHLIKICKSNNISCLFGGIPIKERSNIYNTSLFISEKGEILARYDKIYLFKLKGQENIDESMLYTSGESPVTLDWNGWKIGLSICYDLRFPELFSHYLGCDMIFCTAAFTKTTGKVHWHTLLKARAVENQCFVAGVNQCGKNAETGTEFYGGTSIYNGWGKKIAESANFEENMIICDIKKSENISYRSRLPVLTERMKRRL